MTSKTMPREIAEIRREICGRCDAKCAEFSAGSLNHEDPSASCPREWAARWGCYGRCGDSEVTIAPVSLPVVESAPAPKQFGLGDLVAVFAEPIARVSDATIGTKLVGCGSCAERRAALNRLVPKL
jgi:hypothetical protein